MTVTFLKTMADVFFINCDLKNKNSGKVNEKFLLQSKGIH